MNENPYCACVVEDDVRVPSPRCPMPNHQLPDKPSGARSGLSDPRDWDDDE